MIHTDGELGAYRSGRTAISRVPDSRSGIWETAEIFLILLVVVLTQKHGYILGLFKYLGRDRSRKHRQIHQRSYD